MGVMSKLFPWREKRTQRHIPELHDACYRGQIQRVQRCIQDGQNVNEPIDMDNAMNKTLRNVTPLFLAAQQNHAGVVRVLLQHGADPTLHAYCQNTKDYCSPVQVALLNMNPSIAMTMKRAIQESYTKVKKRVSADFQRVSSAGTQGKRASDGLTERRSHQAGSTRGVSCCGGPARRARGSAPEGHLASSGQLSSQASSQGPAVEEEKKSIADSRPSPSQMASPFENKQNQEQAKQVVLQPAVSRMSSLSSNESLFGGKPAAPKQQPQRQEQPRPQQGQPQQQTPPRGSCEIEPAEKPDTTPAPIYLPLPPSHSPSISKEDGWGLSHARSASNPLTAASREGPLGGGITPTTSSGITPGITPTAASAGAAGKESPLAPKPSNRSARDVPLPPALSPAASREGLPWRPKHGRSATTTGTSGREGATTSVLGPSPSASREVLVQPKHHHTRSAIRYADAASPSASRDGPLQPKHSRNTSRDGSVASAASGISPKASIESGAAFTRHARAASSGEANGLPPAPKPKHTRTQSLQQKFQSGFTSLSISAAQLSPQVLSENLRQRAHREEEIKKQRDQEQQAKRAKVEEQKAKERQKQQERAQHKKEKAGKH